MPEALPEFLINYLTERDNARATRAAAFLDSLTARERALFHDAAVMGYVRGSMHPRGEDIPLNKPIIAEVVDACFVFPDLYPAVNAHFENHHSTVEYLIQCRQDDGSWAQFGSTSTDAGPVVVRLAAHREANPDTEYRIARRTITTVLEIALEPEPES